jgi:ATP-dependent helicase/nuclease subunit B
MNGIILLPPGTDMIDEIASLLLSDGASDLSSAAVVFPGKRPAHYLRKKIASVVGSGYFPPRIFSMDEFVDHAYESDPGRRSRAIDGTDAAAILYEIHRASERPIGGDSFQRADDFLPLAMELFRELEEFCMSDVSPAKLRETVAAYDTGQIGGVERYYSQFYRIVKERGLSTRAMRYLTVARESFDPTGFSRLIIAGVYLLTVAERKIVEALSRRSNVRLVFQDAKGMRSHLEHMDLASSLPAEETATPAEPEIFMYKSPDTHGQVFALSGILKQELDSGKTFDERSVIVAPAAETLFPLIEQSLSLFETDAYNISLGYPFTRSTLHGFLGSLMDAIVSRENDRYYAPDYLRFALHPYTKNIRIAGNAEPSRILFHALEDHFTGNPQLGFFRLEEIEDDETLFQHIGKRMQGAGFQFTPGELQLHLRSVHDNTLRPMHTIGSIGDLARICIDVSTYIYDTGTAHRHPLFSHFAGHFIESLTALQSSLIAPVAFEEPKAYFNFFRQFAADVTIPFSGTPLAGLQVLGFLETRALKFDTVYFLDTNDDVISGLKRDEPLIPNSIRTRLGIPTYRDREKLNAYYIDALVQNAREVRFFFIERDKKEKSRYLEQMIWDKQKQGIELPLHSIRYNVRLSNPEPGPIAKSADVALLLGGMRFSATALDTYLRCQLRFYYRYVLGLQEREELDEDIDYLTIGGLVHEILKRFFMPLKGRPLNVHDVSAADMERTVDEAFADAFGSRLSGKAYLLRLQVHRRMNEFLTAYQLPALRGGTTRIVDLETQLETTYGGYRLFGTIDRIEKRGDTFYIIDYKISSNADRIRIDYRRLAPDVRASWYASVGSLQLPVYARIFSDHFSETAERIEPVFLLLGKQRIDSLAEHPLFDADGSRQDEEAALNAVLKGLLDELVDPASDFLPAEDLTAECPSCPYRSICGTRWTAV